MKLKNITKGPKRLWVNGQVKIVGSKKTIEFQEKDNLNYDNRSFQIQRKVEKVEPETSESSKKSKRKTKSTKEVKKWY